MKNEPKDPKVAIYSSKRSFKCKKHCNILDRGGDWQFWENLLERGELGKILILFFNFLSKGDLTKKGAKFRRGLPFQTTFVVRGYHLLNI